ncbi:MAG: phytanoyl-CoA dioxygenase family protein [Candidatus Latescibacterota bacterium]|nr:phytanoyl-CoA dioxygenase family protein [Candidatus Latescibacterota bacterium]
MATDDDKDFGFSEKQRARFLEHGYLRLGHVLTETELSALQQRIDEIMMGQVCYQHMRMQLLDPESGQLRRTMGHEVACLAYRRIDDLEQDPLFLAFIQHSRFASIARNLVGQHVSVFRSMFMNKPANWAQTLPWHQDVGVGWGIDTNPIMTMWTALDSAGPDNGGMQIVPGSHRQGIINERHFLAEDEIDRYAPEGAIMELDVEAGESILLHNFLLHRSGTNPTSAARRAFSVTYMDGATRTLDTGQTFPVVFGSDALDPETVPGKPAELVEKFYG